MMQPKLLSEEEQAARMKTLIASATATSNASTQVKMKFHFFTFQLARPGTTEVMR